MDRKKRIEASLDGLFSRKKAPQSAVPAPVEAENVTPPTPPVVEPKTEPSLSEVPVQPQVLPVVDPAPQIDPPADPEPVKAVSQPVIEPEPQPAAPAVKPQAPVVTPAAPANAPITKTIEVLERPEEHLLIFLIDDTYYGIDVSAVQTTIKPQQVFLVPNVSPEIKGLINLRGQIVAVVDLRTRFGLPEKEVNRETRFVVASTGDVMAAMVVDAVTGVETIPGEEIKDPTGMVLNMDTSFLRAIAHHEDRLILLLDLRQTITHKA